MPSAAGGEDARQAEILSARRTCRDNLLKRRMALRADHHRRLSRGVLDSLRSAVPGLQSARVGLFWPGLREVSVIVLANGILAGGGDVSLPAVLDPQRPIQFRAWRPGDPLATGDHGVPVPRDGPAVRPDVVLAPLVGFDGACRRLGYGGGAYNRLLAAAEPRPLAIGVGFEFMRLAAIEPLPEDIPMDIIVTETGAILRSDAGG